MTKLQREQIINKAIKGERERIMKAMMPAFDDFDKAGQTMIQSKIFVKAGTEIIENIGYMKSVLMDVPSLSKNLWNKK